MAYTNIRLKTETRDRLKSRGFKGEDYDHVIVRLLDATEPLERHVVGPVDSKPIGHPLEPADEVVEGYAEDKPPEVSTGPVDKPPDGPTKPADKPVRPVTEPQYKKVIEYILSELEAGREPILGQVATHFGLDNREMGRDLAKLGVRAKETTRNKKSGNYYTHDRKKIIEMALRKIDKQ